LKDLKKKGIENREFKESLLTEMMDLKNVSDYRLKLTNDYQKKFKKELVLPEILRHLLDK